MEMACGAPVAESFARPIAADINTADATVCADAAAAVADRQSTLCVLYDRHFPIYGGLYEYHPLS